MVIAVPPGDQFDVVSVRSPHAAGRRPQVRADVAGAVVHRVAVAARAVVAALPPAAPSNPIYQKWD